MSDHLLGLELNHLTVFFLLIEVLLGSRLILILCDTLLLSKLLLDTPILAVLLKLLTFLLNDFVLQWR